MTTNSDVEQADNNAQADQDYANESKAEAENVRDQAIKEYRKKSDDEEEKARELE